MKKLSLGFVLLAMTGTSAQAQMAVIDPASIVQEVQMVAAQSQQLAQQISQYQQMVQNAKALSNLNGLLQQFQIDPAKLSAIQLSLLFNDVYGLTATDPNFTTNARSLLGQQYSLPMTSSAAQTTVNGLFSPNDATVVTASYNRGNRDLGQALQYSDVVSGALSDRQQSAQSLQQQVGAAQSLTDNSQGAAVQALVAGQINAQQQADILLRLQALQADKQIQDQLRQIERDTAIQRAILDETQARINYRNGVEGSLTASSVRFQ